jgi:hypothetical protein
MAYAEKHGRGYRARWKDEAGKIQSVSGFGSKQEAAAYGTAREGKSGPNQDVWTALHLMRDSFTEVLHVAESHQGFESFSAQNGAFFDGYQHLKQQLGLHAPPSDQDR